MERLDAKSIASFIRVAGVGNGRQALEKEGPKHNDEVEAEHDGGSTSLDIIERATKEGENLSLTLRSGGRPFPAAAGGGARRGPPPSLVVGLAHHRPTDVFLLLAFDPRTLPCRLARFDRDGNVVDGGNRGGLWGDADAAALAAAVDRCRAMEPPYFDVASEASGDFGGSSGDDNAKVGGGGSGKTPKVTSDDDGGPEECLRLVPRHGISGDAAIDDEQQRVDPNVSDDEESIIEEESDEEGDEDEVEAIRAVVVNELLHPPGDGGGVVFFRHPDPKFLLPLSRAISKELHRWRHLRRILPPPSDWPEPTTSDAKTKEGWDEEEFDRITTGRTEQFEQTVELCRGALTRMESHLLEASHGATAGAVGGVSLSSAFQLGRECNASLAALERLQRRHVESWQDYHQVFEDTCRGMECNQRDSVPEPWLGNEADFASGFGEERRSARGKDRHGEESEVDSSDVEDVANSLVRSWMDEDGHILRALSRAASVIQTSLETGDRSALKTAYDHVLSAKSEVRNVAERTKTRTIAAATSLVKLLNVPCSDDDEEDPWMKHSASWTTDEVESQLSFGWRISEREEHAPMSFVADHLGLMSSLKNCMDAIESTPNPSYDDDYGGYSEQGAILDRRWNKVLKGTLDGVLRGALHFLDSRDLRNATLLITRCCIVLCDFSHMAKLRKWFSDPDDSYGSKDIITNMFQKTIRELDVIMVKIALAYFDIASIEAGAHWLYDILSSGVLFFPTRETDISWRKCREEERWSNMTNWESYWFRYSHPAAAIFAHGGWKHPIIISTMKGETSTTKLSNIEAPVVIKERFNLMKSEGNIRQCISLARCMNGDQECMHFLFANGLANEAIVQASSSRNIEGLARLSKDLILTNLHASILCMQAHVLGSLENLDEEYYKHAPKSIDNFVDLFRKRWLVAECLVSLNAEETTSFDQSSAQSNVPSLHILSTISLTGTFLGAAKSTHEMQSLLESNRFADSGASVAIAAIALIVQATNARKGTDQLHDSIKYFLHETNLLSVSMSHNHVKYSGLLTRFGFVPASLGKKVFLDICCALYRSARYLMEERRAISVFLFDLAIFSATHIAVLSRCELFTLEVICSFMNGGRIKEYGDHSPMNSLSACYAFLFSINCNWVPRISKTLLDSFFDFRVPSSSARVSDVVNGDVIAARIWMTVAYLQHGDAKQAASRLVDNILHNQRKDGYSSNHASSEKYVVETIETLSSIDGDGHTDMGLHTMSSFERSPNRRRVTESERHKMMATYIERLLEASGFLSAPAVAKCIKWHRVMNPSFWNHGLHEVEQRISNWTELASTLSKKKSLPLTCTVMFFMDRSIRNNETWCNRYTLLECGLKWIRNALSSSQHDIVQFDNSEQLRGYIQDRFKENYTNLFREENWEYNSSESLYYNDRVLDGKPKFTAKALIAVLQTNVLVLKEESPELSHLCGEALALCSVLDFLLQPTPQRLDAVLASQSELGLWADQFPSHLHPACLVSLVVDKQWSAKPDFPFEVSEYSRDTFAVSFLVPRVVIAIQYGKIKEAAVLALSENTDVFWTKLSDRPDNCRESRKMTMVRGLLHSCLLVLKAAIGREELPEEFVNFAMHLALSMNWLQACDKCSPSPLVSKKSHSMIVSVENVAALHETATAWNELNEKKSGCECSVSLAYCLEMISCLSRCVYGYEENHCPTECSYCCLNEDHCVYGSSPSISQQNRMSAREERAKLRKKRKWQRNSGDIQLSFNELESIASQLHMREASDWCKDALQKISNSLTSQQKKKAKRSVG